MPARERTTPNGRTQDRGVVPILEARPGGAAQRFAASMEGKHPAAVFFAAVLAGYVVLAGLAVLLGVLVTDVLVHTGGIGRADESAVESLVRERTGFLTSLSSVGSAIGGAPVLPILVALIGVVCAIARKWRIAAFAALVLLVESATYRIASIVVPRDRPHVARLDDLPADDSYPSGHTAASLAVYCGLVLLLTSAFPKRRWRVAAWLVALLLPVFVAFSRMYRGMHHPLDVGAGALIGIGAVVVLLFACRAAGVAAPDRAPARAGAPSLSHPPSRREHALPRPQER
jgi:membrane-associated phospholipid phosphatase